MWNHKIKPPKNLTVASNPYPLDYYGTNQVEFSLLPRFSHLPTFPWSENGRSNNRPPLHETPCR